MIRKPLVAILLVLAITEIHSLSYSIVSLADRPDAGSAFCYAPDGDSYYISASIRSTDVRDMEGVYRGHRGSSSMDLVLDPRQIVGTLSPQDGLTIDAIHIETENRLHVYITHFYYLPEMNGVPSANMYHVILDSSGAILHSSYWAWRDYPYPYRNRSTRNRHYLIRTIDWHVEVWDMATGEYKEYDLPRSLQPLPVVVEDLSRDLLIVVHGDSEETALSRNHDDPTWRISEYSIAEEEIVRQTVLEMDDPMIAYNPPWDALLSPNTRYLAMSHPTYGVWILDRRTEMLHEIDLHPSHPNPQGFSLLDWSWDGSRLAYAQGSRILEVLVEE